MDSPWRSKVEKRLENLAKIGPVTITIKGLDKTLELDFFGRSKLWTSGVTLDTAIVRMEARIKQALVSLPQEKNR
jgi:hypothetical protein